MGKEHLYALSVRSEMENAPLDKKTRFDNKALETSISGALSFLTSQINLSSSLIYYGDNEVAKKTILPKVMKGELRIANAVSHLRSDIPAIDVQKINEGYIVNGAIKWLTGFGHFEQFILGFSHEGQEYFALLPFADDHHNGQCQISPPLQVMVMQSTQTVTASLKDWFIPEKNIVNRQEAGNWYHQMKTNHHILPYFYGIGMSALALLNEYYKKENAVTHALLEELNKLRDKITSDLDCDFIALRVKITNCAWKCVQLAVIASKGQAMDPNSRISRLYREIVQFNALATIPEYINEQLSPQ